MKKEILFFTLTFILISFFIVSCTSSSSVSSKKQCSVDSDCVKATCCHATDAVNKENQPDCSQKVCSLRCEPETVDCGQGEIKCIENTCMVIIK